MHKIKLPFSLAIMTAVICTVGFSFIAIWIGDNQIRHFDAAIISWVQNMESPPLTKIMKFFTLIGSGYPIAIIMIAVMIFLYIFLHHRKELVFLAWIVIGSALLNLLLKLLFQRARPTIHRIAEATGYSFPSGHSMAAFGLYGALAFLLWKHVPTAFGRIILIILSSLFILAIGTSRIYLGVHYPSDVLGGYFTSGCLLAVSIWYYQRYLDRLAQVQSKHTA